MRQPVRGVRPRPGYRHSCPARRSGLRSGSSRRIATSEDRHWLRARIEHHRESQTGQSQKRYRTGLVSAWREVPAAATGGAGAIGCSATSFSSTTAGGIGFSAWAGAGWTGSGWTGTAAWTGVGPLCASTGAGGGTFASATGAWAWGAGPGTITLVLDRRDDLPACAAGQHRNNKQAEAETGIGQVAPGRHGRSLVIEREWIVQSNHPAISGMSSRLFLPP